MSECKCDLRTRLVGDGCEVCNPTKALEYAKETICDLEGDICALLADIKSLPRYLPSVAGGARTFLGMDRDDEMGIWIDANRLTAILAKHQGD